MRTFFTDGKLLKAFSQFHWIPCSYKIIVKLTSLVTSPWTICSNFYVLAQPCELHTVEVCRWKFVRQGVASVVSREKQNELNLWWKFIEFFRAPQRQVFCLMFFHSIQILTMAKVALLSVSRRSDVASMLTCSNSLRLIFILSRCCSAARSAFRGQKFIDF